MLFFHSQGCVVSKVCVHRKSLRPQKPTLYFVVCIATAKQLYCIYRVQLIAMYLSLLSEIRV